MDIRLSDARIRLRASRVALLALAFALGASLVTNGRSEGAVKRLDCRVSQVCDGGGRCESGGERMAFTIAPLSVLGDGGGRYRIEYGDKHAEARAFSDVGPFYWTEGGDSRHTLVASSETEWLWHKLSTAPAPLTSVSFLVCSLQQ